VASGSVEECTFQYWPVEHLFQTDRLSTELHLVRPVWFRSAALILYRKGLWRLATELHDIGLPHNAEHEGAERNAARQPHAGPRLWSAGIRLVEQKPAFRSCRILAP
jgi:hypothetical protein